MTGASTQTALMSQIVEFTVNDNNLDLEKLRRVLYCQVMIRTILIKFTNVFLLIKNKELTPY